MTKVLIVDDRRENRHVLNTLLASEGYTIEEAVNGAEALSKARANPPDLIISDLLMPFMDGYTLLRIWKTEPRLQPIPFIVYTATYTSSRDERLALDLGADAFIIKPIKMRLFLDRIRAVLEAERTGRLPPPRQPADEEQTLLKEYNAVLVRKLEEANFELQEVKSVLEQDIGTLRRIEADLRESEEKFTTAFMSSPVYLGITDQTGRWVEVNDAFCNALGFARAEVIGKTSVEIGILNQSVRERAIRIFTEAGGCWTTASCNY